MHPTALEVVGLLVAALCGAAVGVEREWSGHATGPEGRFAGVRTFTLLGGLAGTAGWLWTHDGRTASAVLLAGACALVVTAYAASSRRHVDGTTETAALVVTAAGFLAGLGALAFASGVTAITCLLLIEKTTLHSMVARLDDVEIRAGVRFAVMAAVVLPLLPSGPFGPLGGIRPRALWALVLFFSGLSFAGYVLRRLAGPRQGYQVAGLLGGLLSSTSVTLNYARLSRQAPELGLPLARGVVGACTTLLPRVFVAAFVLSPPLAGALAPYVAAPFGVGLASVLVGWRRIGDQPDEPPRLANPLEFGAAVQMALLFQVVLIFVWWLRAMYGGTGLLVSGFVAGMADLDAVTVSMAQAVNSGAAAAVAARGVAAALVSNTLLKMVLAASVGCGPFRNTAVTGLALQGAAAGAALWLLR